MPFKRLGRNPKNYKKATRKVYKKKATKPLTYNRSMVRVGLGFPKKMQMTHTYFETLDLQIVGGATVHQQYSCNGLFDPYITGGGHQPMYYDQMIALYSHYTCIGSKIKVTIGNSSSSNTNTTVVLWKNDDIVTTPTLNALVEQTGAKYQIINAGNLDTHVFTNSWSAKKTFGGSVLGNDDLQGTAGSNPVEQTIYQLSAFPQNLTSTQSLNYQVHISYIVIWDELRDIGGS